MFYQLLVTATLLLGHRESSMSKRRPKIPQSLRVHILERDGYKCRICGDTADLCIDHIIPKFQGGADSEDNLQVLCRTCNAVKQHYTLSNDEIKRYLELYEQSEIISRHSKVWEINVLIDRDLWYKRKMEGSS